MAEHTQMQADIVIIGAGPAGLCMARALSGHGLRITVVEQQPLEAITAPAFDGREIALTQHSVQVMRELGLWELIGDEHKSPLCDAKILDGPTPGFAMVIGHQLSDFAELGWLVSNHLIRQAAFDSVQQAMALNNDITLLAGQKVVDLHSDPQGAHVELASQTTIHARLAIAADSRFSATRRMMGIAAEMHDFGKNMLVCVMTHDKPHDSAAWEWFDYGQTLALLPMNPDPATQAHRSSVVISLSSQETESLMAMEPAEFGRNVSRRFKQRWGDMQLASTRHSYPLVTVFPDRLIARRFATVGDAAVGMHPVTAHGFNLGLLSIESLAGKVLAAHRRGADFADGECLSRYERKHLLAARPLYLMTRLIVELYTRESPPARLARKLLLRLGEQVTPFKRSIAASLTGR
jgi:ubiquinone biosynthesis UbiH/UbiF/VisC/COQ6 family hydroxylase